ncbi:hypothetical protein [Geomonas azotofigens]|uniref:hypothetical protein n=1 Tax=Geomonas azotofigens TaxID=2843196 RepID=UPI001C117402|nr:hypothetical protein [Geomonas azotofigens]MBU5614519.1 hypothetical protein [Geomonas azotofigens]
MNSGANAFENFRLGGNNYPKVDMSLWDQATMCATCHVGGVFYEQDREGNRLPAKTMADWGPSIMDNTQPPASLNPITATVWENYDPATGKDQSFVTMSPWVYPVYMGRGGAPDPTLPGGGPMTVPNGWGVNATMANPNGGSSYTVVNKQLMMPNVKEMDCLFCHLKGYDNVMASVMVQAGSLSATPTTGAGLFDMFSLSQTFMGYDPNNGKTSFVKISDTPMGGMLGQMGFASYSSHELVFLTAKVTDNIKGKPDENNCHQCHATKTLKNFPEMFGVTGGSTGFLSSAPMVYDPAYGVGPLGKRMVNYDINSPFMQTGTSPKITADNFMNFMMPGLTYLQANGPSPFNTLGDGELGGGNMAMTGPLYYYTMTGQADQNTLKKSTMPFPRAEWFKRGDAWQAGQDVHGNFGCAGCHFTGNSTDKNMCDPARGFDAASTIQDGLPAFKERQPVIEGGDVAATIKKHDTRNTIKRCEFCHVTGTDYQGNPIETFGAPNPNTAHANAGLLANINQMVDKMGLHGDFGGKGVPRESNFTSQENGTTAGGTILSRGNHLDVMDCTVCHVNKVSMAVRSLDASSGMRFPAIVGTDPSRGMLGLFEDPTGMGADVTKMGGKLQNWKPVAMWQPYGNMELPLSMGNTPKNDLKFRRKLYLTNPITAVLWNNESGSVDANGDGVPGGLLIGDDPVTGQPTAETKPSLKGYRDIFTGDVPDANNTSGFEKPIFDPWAMRDLKSGFNFVPGPLSVISTGFGGFGTPAGKTDPTGGAYQSLYGPNGMFANDNWKYASVWSGAVVFTEPDQIRGYKAYRTAIKDATDGKSWDGTTLTLIGAPFMVTHGVKSVSTYVKGKSCADCHAAGAGFFKGSFDMIGPALPSTQTYDPSTYPTVDTFGNLVVDAATGEPVRPAAKGWTIEGDQGNMMMRPLEPVRIKAYKGDLTGYFEGYNKLGQPREINFVHDVNVAGTEYSYASTVDRSEILYPEEDGAIYYKVGQVNADGSVNGGAPLDGAAYATYLETGIDTNLANYGIGIAPQAVINTPLADDDAVQLGVQWATGVDHAVTAKVAQVDGSNNPVGTVAYTWTTSDPAAVITNANSRTDAKVKFTTTGSKTVTLTVVDEEGKTSSTYVTVNAIVPPVTIAWDHALRTATFSNLPSGTNQVKVYWGDGGTTTKTSGVTSPLSLNHTYTTTTQKVIKIYCYNSGVQVGYMQATITP